MSDLYRYGKQQDKYRNIRHHAKTVLEGESRICAATGYDLHVEVCHIIPIHAFRDETPLNVVNDKRNLVFLSPTPHWELDHGFLSISDVGMEESFGDYIQELLERGCLKNEKTATSRLAVRS